MDGLALVPLALALLAAALLAATWASRTLDRAFGHLALRVFGRYVRREGTASTSGTRARRKRTLQAAHRQITYRLYAAKTLLYATVAAVAGSVVAVYLVVGVVTALRVPAAELERVLPTPLEFLAGSLSAPTFSVGAAFALLVASSATVGVATAVTVYEARWWWPRSRAEARARRIDATMERTVAFLYALSRSGMAFPEVLRIVTSNKHVYGEAAREFDVAVREMELFGADMHEAVQRLSERTPSDEFAEFCDNLGSVLRSGRDLGDFLRTQHEYYQSESEARQQQFLDLLGTLAEGYVTVLVAGPLFLLTILVIVGLLVGQTRTFIAVIVYLLIPLSTLGVLVYLDSLSIVGRTSPRPTAPDDERFGGFDDIRRVETPESATDGGAPASRAVNAGRLDVYRSLRWLINWIENPVQNVVRRPVRLLAVTVPLAVLYVLARTWGWLWAGALPPVTAVDGVLAQATLFVLGTFAVVYEHRQRQLRAIERAVPDFLDRLASINEAGMPISESVGQVVETNLGALDQELKRTWTDVQWGARVEDALARLDRRVRSVAITRAVTLITNALHASGDVGPVLRIAADEAKAVRRLARERRQELFTYVVVIYVSFFVFLAIVVALNVYFLPSVPTADQFTGQLGERLGSIGNLTAAEKRAYETLFFHATMVQGVCSGLVAGQMGEDDVRAGAKHAAVLLGVGYVAFLVLA